VTGERMFENVLQKFTGAKAADKSDSFKHLWRCSLSEFVIWKYQHLYCNKHCYMLYMVL